MVYTGDMKKIFSAKQKAQVALEAVKGIKALSQVASDYAVHPIQVGVWKKQLVGNAHLAFEQKTAMDDRQELIDRLYKIIGQRDTELEWLKKKLHVESS